MKTILTLSLAFLVLSHAYPPSSSFMIPRVINSAIFREITKVVISRVFFSLAEISHKIDLLSGNGLLGQPTTLCSVFQFIGNEEDG